LTAARKATCFRLIFPEKACPQLISPAPKQTLRLVLWCIQCDYLMNAMLGKAVAAVIRR
jgi:hypothetical protein